MITKTIKTTNGPLKITIPSEKSEITLGILRALTPKPGYSFSELEQLSILSGLPIDSDDVDKVCLNDICNLDDLKIFDDPLQLLAFQIQGMKYNETIPKGITLDIQPTNIKRWFGGRRVHVGKYVTVANNLGVEPAGAYLEAKELMRAEFEEWERIKKTISPEVEFSPSVDTMIRLLSLYLYTRATGLKFNSTRAAEFDSVIEKLPITKALPIARYFFLKYLNFLTEKPKH